MKNRSLKWNNLGFSLIEMIVAVLIMAIVAGAAIFAVGALSSTETKAASTRITDALKQTRTSAMALTNANHVVDIYTTTDVYAKFYTTGNTSYVDICTGDGVSTETKLFERKIGTGLSVEFYYDDSGVLKKINDNETDVVYIYFKKSTGGIASIMKVKEDGSGVLRKTELKQIKVANKGNSSSTKNLIVVGLTGRCYIDE